MNSLSVYKKSQPQITLENILHLLKYSNLQISQLSSDPKYASLHKDLKESISGVINVIVHESHIHDLIATIAQSYSAQYLEDVREYDTLYEVESETMLGLYSVITKESTSNDIDNRGRIRIDTYQDKEPEAFVCILRNYIQNNICLDVYRKHRNEAKKVEPDTTIVVDDDNDEEISKLDSCLYNKRAIEASADNTDSLLLRMEFAKENVYHSLIDSVIARFGRRKPHAAYIYLLIMGHAYDPVTIVKDLTTKDFNYLFHAAIHNLEYYYDIDLSIYEQYEFSSDRWVDSLRSIKGKDEHDTIKKQCKRIHNLADVTRSTCVALPAFKVVKAKFYDETSMDYKL